MVLEVPQDASVHELVAAVAAELPTPAKAREFTLACEALLDAECPFLEVLDIAGDWGVRCVPGPRVHDNKIGGKDGAE